MSYGDLGSFIRTEEPATKPEPKAEVRKVDAVAPARVEAPREEPITEKAPADYTQDAYARAFGMRKTAADKGYSVRMEMPCGGCIMEMARAMAGG